LDQAESIHREGNRYRVAYEPERVDTAQLLEAVQRAGRVRDLSVEGIALDEMVAALYKEMAL